MNRTELVAKIAEKTGLTKKDAEKAVNAFVESVVEAVTLRDEVRLIGFGTFLGKDRAAREGRNPQTGAIMQLPASVSPVFKVGKNFRDAVNKKH
jgi:DNA-binding protein HU-beta